MNSTSNGGANGERHLTDDLFLDLVHDLLDADRRAFALAHLVRCEDCEAILKEMVSERERVRARVETEPVREPRATRGPSTVWSSLVTALRTRGIGIAAGLAGAAAILLVLLVPRGDGAPDLRWLPAGSDALRFRASDATGPGEDLINGLNAYANHDLDTAIASLKRAETAGQLETIRKIYLGNSLTWNGDYDEAVEVLSQVDVRLLPDPWGGEAQWSFHLALEESGRVEAADSLLEVLSRRTGEIGERAKAKLMKRRPPANRGER